MKRNVVYTDAPFDYDESLVEENIVEDFLPSPEYLARTRVKSSAIGIIRKIRISNPAGAILVR